MAGWFRGDADDRKDGLALARFDGVRDALLPLHPRAASAQERGRVLCALASARLIRAEQMARALRSPGQSEVAARNVRRELLRLVDQLDVLAMGATLELAQPNSTAGAWAKNHSLGQAVSPQMVDVRVGEGLIYIRAVYQGALILLTTLRDQLAERERIAGVQSELAEARLLLTQAQHVFDVLGPLVEQLDQRPELFDRPATAEHDTLERQVATIVSLLDRAAVELAAPGATRVSPWLKWLAPAPLADTPVRRVAAPMSRPAGQGRYVLVGLALLLLLGACGGLFLLRGGPGPSDPAAPSAVPVAIAEGQDPDPPRGRLLRRDTFDDPASGWAAEDREGGAYHYRDGVYEMSVDRPQYILHSTTVTEYTDIDVAVDITHVAGPADSIAGGLVLREQEGNHYYLYEAQADGRVALIKVDGRDDTGLLVWEPLINRELTSLLRPGQTNRLRVVAQGYILRLYVNDVLLRTLVDASFASGSVGLAIDSWQEGGGLVRFDNFEIREP